MNKISQYSFINKNTNSIIVILEPWAEEFTLPAESKISIVIDSGGEGVLETEINPKYFIIWLWAGCRAQVSINGEDRTPGSLSIPVFG